jgi:hypothetical protein
LLPGRAAFGNEVGERQTLDVLHHDVGATVLLAQIVNGGNVRMVQRGSQTRLAQQAGPREFIIAKCIREYFNRYRAFQAQVAAAINHARAAFAQASINLVVG